MRNDSKYLRIWGSSVISDTLVSSIIQNIDKVSDVFEMADQAIQKVMEQEIEPSAGDFTQRFKELATEPPIKIFK